MIAGERENRTQKQESKESVGLFKYYVQYCILPLLIIKVPLTNGSGSAALFVTITTSSGEQCSPNIPDKVS
jgi:hypothetical protein